MSHAWIDTKDFKGQVTLIDDLSVFSVRHSRHDVDGMLGTGQS